MSGAVMSAALPATRPSPGRLAAATALVAGLGPMLPLGAMTLGLLVPEAAAAANEDIAVFVVAGTFCGILALPPGAARGNAATAAFAVALCLAAPPLACLLTLLAGAGTTVAAWAALVAAVPIGPGAIGFAAALGRASPRFAGLVLASVAPTFVIMPATIAAGIEGLAADEAARRLLLFSLLPVVAGLLARRAWTPTGETRAALLLVACVALSLQALARVTGAAEPLFGTPFVALHLLALACLPSLAAAVAALLLSRLLPAAGIGGAEALLAGGYRNGTVAWIIAAPVLPPEGHLFMALTALPVFATPALVCRLVRRGRATEGTQPHPFPFPSCQDGGTSR